MTGVAKDAVIERALGITTIGTQKHVSVREKAAPDPSPNLKLLAALPWSAGRMRDASDWLVCGPPEFLRRLCQFHRARWLRGCWQLAIAL
jgi:hypothetical protein